MRKQRNTCKRMQLDCAAPTIPPLPPRCAHKRAGAAQSFSAAALPRLWRRCPTAAWRTWGAPRCRLCEPLVCRRQRAGRAPCARNRFGKNARCSGCARAHEKTPVAKTRRFNWSYLIVDCFGCVCVLLLLKSVPVKENHIFAPHDIIWGIHAGQITVQDLLQKYLQLKRQLHK